MSHGNEGFGGATGEGKSNTVRLRVRPAIDDPNISVVSVDFQPFSTSWNLWKDAVGLGQASRTIFNDLSWVSRLILTDRLLPSSVGSVAERAIEEKRRVERFLDALGRKRGFASFDDHPLLKTGGEGWSLLMMHQSPRLALDEGWAAFHPERPEFTKLCYTCDHRSARERWMGLPKSASARQQLLLPIERLVDPIINSPSVIIRDGMGHGFNLHSWLDRGGHVFVQGGHNISRDECRFLLAEIVLDVIAYKLNGGRRHVVLIIEEAEAEELVSYREAHAIQTLRKTGFELKATYQSPFFVNEEITERFLQNTHRVWHRCSSQKTAMIGALDLLSVINPWAVHSVEYRLFQDLVGYEQIPFSSETDGKNGKTTTKGFRERPVYEPRLERQVKHLAVKDQITLLAKWLMELRRGEAFAKSDGVRLVQFPLAEDLCSDEQAMAVLDQRRDSPPYIDPVNKRFQSPGEPSSSTGGRDGNNSGPSSSGTRSPSNKPSSSESTPATRRRRGTSNDANP
jgi:hypothetical protein